MQLTVGIGSRKRLNPRWAVIKQTKLKAHLANSSYAFRLYQPKGKLSAYVQGLWSVSVDGSASIKRWLHGDACSGILFNLRNPIDLDNTQYSTKAILLPVSKHAHSITLPPGSQVSGVRFHPGVSFGVFNAHYDKPCIIKDDTQLPEVSALFNCLIKSTEHYTCIGVLYKWLSRTINFTNMLPAPLFQALNMLDTPQSLGRLNDKIPLSQRQLERQFQQWLDMPPKQYQRILRVKKTATHLKLHPNTDLVDLALKHGFSDQAHMTREFKQIAGITPKQYSKFIILRKV